MDIQKEIVRLLGLTEKEKKKKRNITLQRKSKHMGKKFRMTKAYADDRQKASHNRRKNGRRRRK